MEDWRIVLSKQEFEKQKEDERLHALLNFARALNALRFTHVAYLTAAKRDGPAGTRQRLNAFLFNCATMFEAFATVDRLGRYFSETTVFRKTFVPIQRDDGFRRFREKVLPKLRKKLVFHFDADVAAKALENIDLPEYVFAAGRGRKREQVYFDLADSVAVNFLLDEVEGYGDTEPEQLNNLVTVATELTVALMDAGEEFIVEALKESDWQLERRPNG